MVAVSLLWLWWWLMVEVLELWIVEELRMIVLPKWLLKWL